LVDAFHATLEAATDADLLLHVVDSASHARDEQVFQVNKVLEEIGARDVRQVVIWNKIDLTEAGAGVDRDEYGNIARVRLSARSGDGLELLRESLAEYARAKAESRQEVLVAIEREALTNYMNEPQNT
jgi:GTP-binding protein HflX